MDINVNGTSDSSPPSAGSAVSIRSASDSCADSPESAVDAVTIGVDSPLRNHGVPQSLRRRRTPRRARCPLLEPRRPQARSTPEEFHHRWPVRRHWLRCLGHRSCRGPSAARSIRPPWWASRHRRRWVRPAQSTGPAAASQPRQAPGGGRGGAASAGVGRTLRRRRTRGIGAGLRAGDAESLPGGHQHADTECDRQCPDAADVSARTPGERGRRRHRGEVLGCDAGRRTRGLRLTGASRLAVASFTSPYPAVRVGGHRTSPTARGL